MLLHITRAALLALLVALVGCAPTPAPNPTAPSGNAETPVVVPATNPAAATAVALLPSQQSAPTAAASAAATAALPVATVGPATLGAPTATPELPAPTISAEDGVDLGLVRTIGWGSSLMSEGAQRTAAVSPDGRLLAAPTSAGVVLAALPALSHLRFHRVQGGVSQVAFSHGGGLLALAGPTVEIRRVEDWSLIGSFLGGDVLRFSPSDQLLAAVSYEPADSNERPERWTTAIMRLDGSEVVTLSGERAPVFSADSRLFATEANGLVRVYRSADGVQLRQIEGSTPAFSQDNTLLALLSPDGTAVQLWPQTALEDGGEGQPARALPTGVQPQATAEGRALVFADGGQTLRAAVKQDANDGYLVKQRSWRVADGQQLRDEECRFCEISFSRNGVFAIRDQYPNGLGAIVVSILRAADGQELSSHDTFGEHELTYSPDKALGVADLDLALQDGDVPFVVELPGFDEIAYTPDAQTLIGVGADLTLWDVTSGALWAWFRPREYVWEGGPVPPMRWRIEGAVVSAEWFPTRPYPYWVAEAWNAQTGQPLWKIRTPDEGASFLQGWAYASSGASALVYDDRMEIRPSPGVTHTVQLSAPPRGLVFSPDGALLAFADDGGGVRVLRTVDGSPVSTGQSVSKPEGLSFSPDGTLLGAFDAQGTVALMRTADGSKLYDIAAGDPQAGQLIGDNGMIINGGGVRGVIFSPDNTLAGILRNDHTVRIWQIERNQQLLTLPQAPISRLTFTADSQIAIVSDSDGVTLYRLRDGVVLRRISGSVDGSSIGPRRRLLGLLRDGLVEQWGITR
ncbi:MAG TPA: hypothetical protein VFS21_08080 [Roseiflexaceae bacterium]|nr:hypothetical protein [Roseiflexaceae bacterium]